LRVKPKINEDKTFLDEIDKAYIWTAIAIGATHHFPTGSKAADSKTPESAERRSATNLMH
jgi:hypothetical protein